MLPVKTENSSFASITLDKEDKGFPPTTVVAFIYFKTRNKYTLSNLEFEAGSQLPTPPMTQNHQYDDDAAYSGPQKVFGTIKVMCRVNIKTITENLQYDLEGMGLSLQRKQHQSAESSTRSHYPRSPQMLLSSWPEIAPPFPSETL